MTWKICEQARKNIEDETGQSFLCYNEEEAKELCDHLNKKYGNWTAKVKPTVIPYTKSQIHEDFIEWDNIIKWLDKTNRRLDEINSIYEIESKLILQEAIETGVDFKKLYGGNNQQTRKQYVDEQLSDLIDEKNELKYYQSDDLKRIEFLKRLIEYKTKMLDYKEPIELKTDIKGEIKQ